MTVVVIEAKSDVSYLNSDMNLKMYLHGLSVINHSVSFAKEQMRCNIF